MRVVIEIIVRYRNACSLLLTILLSVLMLTTYPDTQLKIMQYLKVSIFSPAYLTLKYVTEFTDVYSENKRLRQELTEANIYLQAAREHTAENKRLTGLLGFADSYDYDLVPVRVIARDPSYQYRSVVVTGGKSQGVEMYMPLVGEHGAVGKVVQVIGNMSMVQLLRDPLNRTSVMVSRSRSVGILHTDNGRDFYVRLRSHDEVRGGDTVVTSGLGGIYPKGLTVGVISNIEDQVNQLFKRAYLDFTVDFDKLEELFIMRLPPRWSAQITELDSMVIEK